MEVIGVNKQRIPTEGGVGLDGWEGTEIKAVLTEDAIGEHAVYVGIGSDEWVMRYGAKLPYKEAKFHFPGLKEDNYRR